MDLCLDETNLTMEVCSGKLLVYRWERILDAGAYEEFLDCMVLDLADLMEDT